MEDVWQDKKTGHVDTFVTKVEVAPNGQQVSVKEMMTEHTCPECGAALVKRNGCTQCSNNECYFEKCAI